MYAKISIKVMLFMVMFIQLQKFSQEDGKPWFFILWSVLLDRQLFKSMDMCYFRLRLCKLTRQEIIK